MPEPTNLVNSQIGNNATKWGCCACCGRSRKQSIAIRNANGLDQALNTEAICKHDLPKDKPIGTTVCVRGRILPNCSRFSLNFQCNNKRSDPSDPDIALHFNPRLHQRYIVRNYRTNGRWGDEDTLSTNGYNLELNQEFNMEFFVSSKNEFLISVNDVHFCSYKIKFPLEQITTLAIKGPVETYGVDIKQLNIYPDPEITKTRFKTIPTRDEFVETIMSTPVTFLLPAGFQRNWQLDIVGKVKILPHSFYLNLQEGSQYWPHPNIPLHLNPRFNAVNGEHVFVRNAWLNGKWGQEERTPSFNFAPGSKFTLSIRLGDHHFAVWVNGKLIGEFQFRGAINKIDTLYIQGDVVVYGALLDKNQ